MRLAALPMIQRNADARAALLFQIELLRSPPKGQSVLGAVPLTVCIDGVRQDDTIVELVRIVLVRELQARVASLEHDLREMGVEIPRAA